jgi:hypothetical protein
VSTDLEVVARAILAAADGMRSEITESVAELANRRTHTALVDATVQTVVGEICERFTSRADFDPPAFARACGVAFGDVAPWTQ